MITEEKKVPVECYTRVTGFYRPTSTYNPGKAQEFSERKMLKMPRIEELKNRRVV